MDKNSLNHTDADNKLAQRLKELRTAKSWSLDELAHRSGVSRATLSRLEKADVSPTTSMLGKLCAVYGLPMSRLMRMVEDTFEPRLHRGDQLVWQDPNVGFHRRSVSPPAQALAGEVLECSIDPDTHITYENPPTPGLEHHLVMHVGSLEITVDGAQYNLVAGDCLRYQLFGASTFKAPTESGAKYMLFLV